LPDLLYNIQNILGQICLTNKIRHQIVGDIDTLKVKINVVKNIAGNNVLLKMPDVLNWLQSLGLRALNTRYTRYVKYVDDFFDMDRQDINSHIGKEKFDILTKAILECFDIIIIYSTFKSEKSEGFKESLSKVIKDPDILENNQVSKARDFLYELLVASYFSVNGYKVDFDVLTDVVAIKNDLVIYSECKRVTSLRKFQNKIKDAGKQLERELPKNKNTCGLIFIDISSLITKYLPKSEVSNHLEAHSYLMKAMNSFLTEQIKTEIERLNERFKKVSLAVCLMGRCSIWTKEPSHYSSTSIMIRARRSMNDSDFNLLGNIVTEFKGAFTDIFKDITLKEKYKQA